MAHIHCIRMYNWYGESYCDIVYTKDGYPSRVYTMPAGRMPRTARRWLEGRTGNVQYDRVFKREETVYLEEGNHEG